MKTLRLVCFCLLALSRLTFAQYQGQTVRIDPAQPRPGQKITMTYKATGSKLANAATVDGIVYWLPKKGEPVAQGFSPAKTGDTYTATVTVPDTVKGFALVFENGKIKDNNQEKSYAFLLYGPDSKPLPGSYASVSKLYTLNYYYVGNAGADAETARKLIDQEVALYPASKRQYMTDYLATFNLGDSTGRKDLKTELDADATLPDLTKEELSDIAYYYQDMGLKKQKEATNKRREAKFGKTFDWGEAFGRFRNEQTPLAQKKAQYDTLKRELTESADTYAPMYMRYVHSIYLKTLADSAQWTDFYALIKAAPADYKPNTMGAYNAIAWDWAEKGKDLEKAAELSKQGTEWARQHIEQPREANDPVYQTDKQLQKNRLSAYGTYADTYGYILLKQGKPAEALPYLKAAALATAYERVDINERYIQALAQADPAAVPKAAEPLITENKSSKGLEEALKKAYVKNHSSEAGFDPYLAGLKKQATAHQKADLREKLISKPAPAFTLVNLDGKAVRLADLKGKTVVVDFWATWCGPCIKSFPGMQQAVEKYKADPTVAFVFVNSWQTEDDKKKNAAEFMARKNYPFNVLLDEKNEVIAAYGVSGIPTKFIIDKTGTIRFKHTGFSSSADAVVDEISMMIDLANEPVN